MNAAPQQHPENFHNLLQVQKENLENMKYYYVYDSIGERRLLVRTGDDVEPGIHEAIYVRVFAVKQLDNPWQPQAPVFALQIPQHLIDVEYMFYKVADMQPEPRPVIVPRLALGQIRRRRTHRRRSQRRRYTRRSSRR